MEKVARAVCFVAIVVLIAPLAALASYKVSCTQQSHTAYEADLNCSLNDYGEFFSQATLGHDPDGAAANLRAKIRNTLQAFGCNMWDGHLGEGCTPRQDPVVGHDVGPYQGWLGGGDVALALSTALVLGGQGKLTPDLDSHFLAVAKSYAFNVDASCGLAGEKWRAGNGCMDDHSVAASAYAWVAAYEYLRGRYGSLYQGAVLSARAQIAATLSTADSVCINVPLAGDGCNGSPADLDASSGGQGRVVSLNSGRVNNIPYGLGLMTLLASASVGLEVAGNPFQPSSDQQLVALGLFREGQEHTTCGGLHFAADCNTSSSGLRQAGCLYCGDSKGCGPDCSDPICLDGYQPNMFPVNEFYQRYFGGTPPADSCYGDGRWQLTYDFSRGDYGFRSVRDEFFGNGRSAFYTKLGWGWFHDRPRLSGQFNPNPPRGFLDGIDGAGCASGWACDPDTPSLPIEVDFKIWGWKLAATTANLASEAVVNGQCGGGQAHRFRYCLPAWTAGYAITAWGEDTVAGESNLPGWTCGTNAPACVWTPVNSYAPKGFLDGIDSLGCASGWACDPDQPDTSIQVQFSGNGQTLATTIANQGNEPAVSQQCGGGVAHRFRYCLPLSTQGIPITATGIDTVSGSATLPGWQCPQNPACIWHAVNNYQPTGFLDGIDGSGCAWGWACDPDQPNNAIQVQFYANGQPAGSATADAGSEPAVNQRCGGGSAHRFRACLNAATKGLPVTAVGIDTVQGQATLPGWQCPENPACRW
jgi:hypothetical protein